jgi:hypothetical protein
MFLDDDLYLFNRPVQEKTRIQVLVWDYLNYINCESGAFNASVCESWKRDMTRPVDVFGAIGFSAILE